MQDEVFYPSTILSVHLRKPLRRHTSHSQGYALRIPHGLGGKEVCSCHFDQRATSARRNLAEDEETVSSAARYLDDALRSLSHLVSRTAKLTHSAWAQPSLYFKDRRGTYLIDMPLITSLDGIDTDFPALWPGISQVSTSLLEALLAPLLACPYNNATGSQWLYFLRQRKAPLHENRKSISVRESRVDRSVAWDLWWRAALVLSCDCRCTCGQRGNGSSKLRESLSRARGVLAQHQRRLERD
jgi:hypothetical protein